MLDVPLKHAPRHLHQKKISNIKIANRTDKKAVEFSKELNLDTIKFKNFKKEMESIDVAIFCTSSKKPIIKKDEIIDISSRRDNELLILDLSVPRNIPISAYEVNDINVINIDNLKDTDNENYKKINIESKFLIQINCLLSNFCLSFFQNEN